jgi:deoxyribodipyrimidine photo-lyase
MKHSIAIFWFRRDLRLEDNAALFYALQSGSPVLPVFIFDKDILSRLEDKADARLGFIHQTVHALKKRLNEMGSDLILFYGDVDTVWKEIERKYSIDALYFNHDYEPSAIERDQLVSTFLASKNIKVFSYKDQCIFEKNEIVKEDGNPYTVFTPYAKKWKLKLAQNPIQQYPSEKFLSHFLNVQEISPEISLAQMNFEKTSLSFPSTLVATQIIANYHQNRDFPAMNGTSKLGLHYRFGTISIREKVTKAITLNEVYLNELIWREFYMQILWHFPHVVKGAFKPQYDRIQWRNNEQEFEKWKNGQTGYPIVDAGMRELLHTGYMHNRVRMIVASFLTKHLLIDWRWGEAWFAQKLLDFELSSNNGGWQWAAGSGTDAAPYFRVFNPALQTEKFDAEHQYIKMWVPEINTNLYPAPIVEHSFARNRCLEAYKQALK